MAETLPRSPVSSGDGVPRHSPGACLLRVRLDYEAAGASTARSYSTRSTPARSLGDALQKETDGRKASPIHHAGTYVGTAQTLTAESSQATPGFHLDVDFTLSSQRTILFGPSGAGKTTLLRLLSGLLAPVSGSIVLEDTTLTDVAAGIALPPGRRKIGYLTQEPSLFPHLSVADNVAYGLHAVGGMDRKARQDRVASLLASFDLAALARRLPLSLSGGERQRVALARALAPEPRLLLLDEPFAALDLPLRERTIAALDEHLAIHGTVVLSISHDVAEVYTSGAEVLLLEAGRIIAQGPSRQVLAPHRERLLRQLEAPPA